MEALNLDGGASAQLAVRGTGGEPGLAFPAVGVPDLLVVTERPSDRQDP